MDESGFSSTAKAAVFQPSNPWDSAEDSDHGSNSMTASASDSRASASNTSISSNNVQQLQKQFQHFNNIISSTSQESLPQFPSNENLPNHTASSFSKPVVSAEEDPWSAASHTSFGSNHNPSGTAERTSASTASFTMPEDAIQQQYATLLPPANSGTPLVRAQLPRLKEYQKLDIIKVTLMWHVFC